MPFITGTLDLASSLRATLACKGDTSTICIPEIEKSLNAYDASTNQNERQRLLDSVQRHALDQWFFVPVITRFYISGIGPRIVNKQDLLQLPGRKWIAPYEDIVIK